MRMRMMIYLTCRSDHVFVVIPYESSPVKTVKITKYDELIDILDESGETMVMCSSTLDFPEESTSDPAIITLCRRIRG